MENGALLSQGSDRLVQQGSGALLSQGSGRLGSQSSGHLASQGSGCLALHNSSGRLSSQGSDRLLSYGSGALSSQGSGHYSSGALSSQGSHRFVSHSGNRLSIPPVSPHPYPSVAPPPPPSPSEPAGCWFTGSLATSLLIGLGACPLTMFGLRCLISSAAGGSAAFALLGLPASCFTGAAPRFVLPAAYCNSVASPSLRPPYPQGRQSSGLALHRVPSIQEKDLQGWKKGTELGRGSFGQV